jgi:hypothetical protein
MPTIIIIFLFIMPLAVQSAAFNTYYLAISFYWAALCSSPGFTLLLYCWQPKVFFKLKYLWLAAISRVFAAILSGRPAQLFCITKVPLIFSILLYKQV